MKREILCPDCRESRLKLCGLEYSHESRILFDPYPGEHIKIIKGRANRHFLCDICNKQIETDDDCFAVSTYADYGGMPYYEWEHEYVH